MTKLGALLAQRIAATGPMTLADYMADCLMHPQFGYYATRDPFGASGDFTTAPEISQMFGELIGLCLAQTWMDQGAPAQITLAEIGPGRGTLMADALRATRGVVGFHAALSVHFIETSPTLRKRQAEAVPDATWHDSIETLPQAPLYLVANEFFDALPIRQFTRDKAGWREHMVGVQGDTLLMGLSAPAPIALLEDRLSDTKEGDIVEHCPALPSMHLHPISPRPFTRQRHAAWAGTGAFRLLGRTAREGDLEGGRRLGGGCSEAQALAAIVCEGRADKERGRGGE